MEEVLRQRQAQIKREHSKQMATLEEKLDEELEKAARQAKEKVSMGSNLSMFLLHMFPNDSDTCCNLVVLKLLMYFHSCNFG